MVSERGDHSSTCNPSSCPTCHERATREANMPARPDNDEAPDPRERSGASRWIRRT